MNGPISSRAFIVGAVLAAAVAACAPAPDPAANGPAGSPDGPTSSQPASAAGAARCASVSSAPPNPSVVHVAIGGSLGAAAQLLAFDRGYFSQMGVSVERTPEINAGNTELQMAALLSGQVDAAGEPVSAALFEAVGQGAGVKIVGTQARQDPGASTGALMVRKALIDSGRVQTYADLKALRIGIPGKGTPAEIQVSATLTAGGLSLSDVTLTTLDFPNMSSALANGALDAGIFPEPFVTQLVSSGIATRWSATSDVVPGQQTTVLVFSPRLLANHELAVRTMMAYLCGARDYTDAFFKNIQREQVVQELVQGTSIKDPRLYDQMGYATVDPNGKVNLADMQAQLNWYTQMGYVTQRVDLASVYDPSIAEEAVARLGVYE